MREDMAKVIVERPRKGRGLEGKGRYRYYQRIDLDELPASESMRPRFGRRKWLNENLAPLKKFLRSRVGRPWNNVYSEIRERISVNSAVQLHIWQHVQEFVCMNVLDQFGYACNKKSRFDRRYFYVDAETGVLCAHPQRWRRKHVVKDTPRDIVPIDEWNQYRRINGIWYLIRLKLIPADPDRGRDVLLHCTCAEAGLKKLGELHGRYVYAFHKRQLRSKEIRVLMKAEQQRLQRKLDGR
jgi:hypothetical protein